MSVLDISVSKDVKVDFKWNQPINKIIADRVKNNATLLFMATTWQKLYDPFVPMDTGMMAHDSVDIYVENGEGIIHHKAPYAAANYHGDRKTFNTEKHQLATAHWDEAAKSAGKKEVLLKDVDAFINKT